MSTFSTVVTRLTGVNGLLVLSAMITAPIQARALGPSGRGAVAIIVTVATLVPFILDLGLSDYVTRERAQGRRLGDVLGTMLPFACCMSLIGVATAIPVSNLLGQGNDTVVLFLRIGLFISPMGVTGLMLYGAARGGGQWKLLYRQRILVAALPALGMVVLAGLGAVTVTSVAILSFAVGTCAFLVVLPALRGSSPWRWRPHLVRPGLLFGARSWVATLSTAGNARLDQLIMAPLVSTAEMGYYAVAVSITGLVLAFAAAVMTALMPRVASGNVESVSRTSRIVSGLLGAALLGIALISPIAVPLVFGGDFRPAVPMVLVLTIASFCIGMSMVLGAGLQGVGRPQDNMRAQVLGLVVTVAGLLIVLPGMGGLGAALVSAVAGSVVLVTTVWFTRRAFGMSLESLLVPRGHEIRDAVRRLWRRN